MFFLRRKKQHKEQDLQSLQQALPDFVRPRVSSRAQKLTLKFDMTEGVFDLVLPDDASLIQARDFALRHRDWMEQRLDKMELPIYYRDGAEIPFLGTLHKLLLDKNLPYRTQAFVQDGQIICGGDETVFAGRIERFLKETALQKLQHMTRTKAAQIDKTVGKIMVRDAKTRWGSCNTEGTISYSWRLIFAPEYAMDYVAAHEVAHLIHMDHSKKFWALCNELSLDMKRGKNWLKNEGRALHRYKK